MAYKGSIGGIEVAGPFAAAGGVMRTVADAEMIAASPAGWGEGTSITIKPRAGNAVDPQYPEAGAVRRVYYHDSVAGLTYNSFGMPNKGIDMEEVLIAEKAAIFHAYGKPYIQNIAPVSTNPVEEVNELAARSLAAGADAVLLNAGCPNVVTEDGGRHEVLSHNAWALYKVLKGLKPITDKHGPIWLRVSPYPDAGAMRNAIGALIATRNVSAVFTPNTWGGQRPLDKNGNPILEVEGNIGGMSGPGTSNEAQKQTVLIADYLHKAKIDVVRSGGITTGAELKRALGAGAVAGAGTTFFYESTNGWGDDLSRLLSEYSDLA